MRAAIVLAAGASTRFGRADKLRAVIRGRTVLDHALDRALASDAKRIIVVARTPDWRQSPDRRLGFVRARRAREGLAASLRAGLSALRPIDREVWIFLGDMPFARAPRGMRLPANRMAARPIVAGRPGHPMLVRTQAACAALRPGDRGLGAVFLGGSMQTWRGGPGNLLDIDDQVTLRRVQRAGR